MTFKGVVEILTILCVLFLGFFPWIFALVDTICWFFVGHAMVIDWTPPRAVFAILYPFFTMTFVMVLFG